MAKIRILIADDHTPVRESTRRLLEQEPDFEIVAEAHDGEEAVRLASRCKPDVAILDIVMPKLDGIEATRHIKNNCAATTVLMLTIYNDDEFKRSALEAGADGYIRKSVRNKQLVEAVRKVYAGEHMLDR